ncbi:uncharacterized protein LOC120327137 [Styela clava]|uniref:uncharacterized protein LOC120327137 n=1 Tax=Styela clava TaxID=7725 RepID=UPI001939C62F|nr:uncharacterized protein LOC120327137 [Styela clava]
MKILWLAIIFGLLVVTRASDPGPDSPPESEEEGEDNPATDVGEEGDTDSTGQKSLSAKSVSAPKGLSVAGASGAKSFRGRRPPICPNDRYVKWQSFCPVPNPKCRWQSCLFKASCAYYRGFYFNLYRPLYFWGYPCQTQGSRCKNGVYGGYRYNCYCRTYWRWVKRRRWFYQDACGQRRYYLRYVHIRIPYGCHCQGSKTKVPIITTFYPRPRPVYTGNPPPIFDGRDGWPGPPF